MLTLVLLLSVCATTEARSLYRTDHVVHTKLGTIRGVGQNLDNINVSAFLGIPYGKTPLGAGRFKRSQMIDKWTGELEAKVPATTCYLTIDNTFPHFPGSEMWNPPGKISEDCLNLNIWVPEEHDGSVMIWIYGGGFFSGSPSLDLYSGTALAAKQHTIVVNINYRLGPFGFLYLGEDSPVQGNMGLLDQQLAIRWVHENIGSFGGDANRVTLFGESAGSASVTAHLFAPDSFKLFQNVICMSGTIMNSWATATPSTMLELSLKLAKRVNCEGNVDQVAKCLLDVPAALIQNEADLISMETGPAMTFAFVPVSADPHFFKGDVFEKIRARDFKKDVNMVIGTVKDEGTYWLPYYMPESQYGFVFNHTISAEDPHNSAMITKSQFLESIKAFLPYFGDSPLVENAFVNAYQNVSVDELPQRRLRDGVARFLGDLFFTCSLLEFADILSDNIYGNVYMYYFTRRSSANPWPRWMGVMHGYEIEYTFGQPFWRPHLYDSSELQVEQQLSKLVMEIWTHFVNTGEVDSYWPKYNKIERKSLEIGEPLLDHHYNIIKDVHGAHCRLIDEAKSFTSRPRDCRSRRVPPTNQPPKTGAAATARLAVSASPSTLLPVTYLILIGYCWFC